MFLKQSAAAVVPFGPFVDKDDGVTEETALGSQSGRIIKSDGTAAGFTPASWAHDGDGEYMVGLSAGDADTLGRLRIVFKDPAVYLPVWRDFVVLSAEAYEALAGGGSLRDWADGEQQQIRKALGLSGDTSDTTGEGLIDAIARRLETLVARPIVQTTITGAQQDIRRYRGDTPPIELDLGRDITGATLAFTVKRRAKDPQSAALITKSSGDPSEIEITDAAAGQFRIKLAVADTADLIPCGHPVIFVYDVEMTLGGVIETVAAGDFVLLPDVTT